VDTAMSDALATFRKAFNQCEFSAARHSSISLKKTLQRVADSVQDDETFDVYGTGALIEDFESDVAQMLGKESAVFLPSGTLAQPIALKIWSDLARSPYVGLHATSHVELHEHKGYQALYDLQGVIVGQAHCVPTLEDIKAAAANPLAALLWELPMREIGGQLPSWDALVTLTQWAKEQGIRCHMDGARLWQCPTAYGKTLAEISDLFDSVYVSFYKDLGGISGAILAGDEDFIQTAKVWCRRAGGNLYSLAPYILAAREGLKHHLPQLPERQTQAIWLAEKLNKLKGISTWPSTPQTNMFRVRIDLSPESFLEKTTQWMKTSKVSIVTPPYEVGHNYCMSEINIGDAFSKLSKEEWAEHIERFSRILCADS
jgi:threonine aldolase